MINKTNYIKSWILFILSLVFLGCSQGTVRTWVNKQIDLGNYENLEINPVFNTSGSQIPEKIPIILTKKIEDQFFGRKLTSKVENKTNYKTLIVRSEIRKYIGCEIVQTTGTRFISTRNPIKSICSLRTQLIDKSTGRIVAEITTTREVPGCYLGHQQHMRLFEEIAESVANDVENLIRKNIM